MIAYRRDLTAFVAFCAAHDINVIDVRRGHVDAWARLLKANGAAPSTVARKIAAVSSFYSYLVADDVLEKSPCVHVKRPETGSDSQTTGLDRDEVRALRRAAAADSPRAHALISLLAGNGLRVSEVLGADVADMGTERGHRTIQITRKVGRQATVPLAPDVAHAIETYLGDRTDGPLFATRTGRRLDEPYLLRLVQRLAKAAGIVAWAKACPHSLRHSFITLSLDAGVPLRDVQDAAGHADPRTTRRYDRARHSLDRHAAYALSSYLAD